MKILYLLPYIPFPLTRGTYLRNYYLIRELSRDHDVDLFCLSEASQEVEREFRNRIGELCHQIRTFPFERNPWSSFSKRIFLSIPAHVSRWWSESAFEALHQFVDGKQYDMLFFCDLIMFPYQEKLGLECKKIIDRSRVDLLFQLDCFRHRKESLKSSVRTIELLLKTWAYERKVIRECDHTIVCGEDDKIFVERYISNTAEISVIENGFDNEYFSLEQFPKEETSEPTILFCGALDYLPNINGLEWYFQKIDSQILTKEPNRRIWIVGVNPGEMIKQYAMLPGVSVFPNVPDVRPYYQKAWMSIVPLKVGGGSRLKIPESLGLQCPVISTGIGAQGLVHLEPDRDILLADTPKLFADAVLCLLQNQGKRTALAEQGRKCALAHYTWSKVFEKLKQIDIW